MATAAAYAAQHGLESRRCRDNQRKPRKTGENERNGKKTRIKDIAAACGVSIAAVSRALKGQPGLSEETRQRILSIAEAEGYDFSRLRNGRIKRLLFLMHREHNIASALPFYSTVMLGVADACRENEIAMSFQPIGPGDSVGELINLHQPDALICAGYLEAEILTELKKTALPVAWLICGRRIFPAPILTTITADLSPPATC